MSGAWKFGSAAIIIFIALYYRSSVDNELNYRLSSVREGLIRVENLHHANVKPRVAIGYGACQDLFVDGRDLLKYDDSIKPDHFSDITTLEQLLKTYAYFFTHGAAAERYISNVTLFDAIVNEASQISDVRYALGGNAPVMATRFLTEGCEVLLAAKMTPKLQNTLPSAIKVVGGDVHRDDIHLIMEYKADETWGTFTSPRANRFIVHNDNNNPLVSSLEEFEKVLLKFKPNLFVVGGLQMMDNYPFPKGLRQERLALIRQQMISQPSTTKIHFEMASFTQVDLIQDLIDFVVPYADSLGMNEQELTNLYSMLRYGNVSLVSDSNPRVATVLDEMRQVFSLINDISDSSPNSRELTRIHVHTLAYQAIFTVKGSKWKNSMAASAKASLTAHRHVCGSKDVNIGQAKLIMDDSFSTSVTVGSQRVPLDVQQPVSCWEEVLPGGGPEIEICVAPVLVCTNAYQTAGGGDNISSAGLALQI